MMVGVEAHIHHAADHTFAGIGTVKSGAGVDVVDTGNGSGVDKERTARGAEVYGGDAGLVDKVDKLHGCECHKCAAVAHGAGVKTSRCEHALVVTIGEGDKHCHRLVGLEFGRQ